MRTVIMVVLENPGERGGKYYCLVSVPMSFFDIDQKITLEIDNKEYTFEFKKYGTRCNTVLLDPKKKVKRGIHEVDVISPERLSEEEKKEIQNGLISDDLWFPYGTKPVSGL